MIILPVGLCEALRVNPADVNARLILADYVDDNTEPGYADVLRLPAPRLEINVCNGGRLLLFLAADPYHSKDSWKYRIIGEWTAGEPDIAQRRIPDFDYVHTNFYSFWGKPWAGSRSRARVEK